MNPVVYEQIMSLLGLIALWAFWFYLWKPQRVDVLRHRLFALRSDLFDLAMSGAVPFDHPAYTQLRLLINGVIRFAHRATFPSFLVAAAQSGDAPPDALITWKRSVENLPDQTRERIFSIHREVSQALVNHVISGSIFLLGYISVRVALSIARSSLLLIVGKREIRNFTVARARLKVDRETDQVAKTAKVIESRVLREEQHRTQAEQRRNGNLKHPHAYAH
jgi:hypothetical protein